MAIASRSLVPRIVSVVVTVCIMALRLTFIDCPSPGGAVVFRRAHTLETSLSSGTFRELFLLTGFWMGMGGPDGDARQCFTCKSDSYLPFEMEI